MLSFRAGCFSEVVQNLVELGEDMLKASNMLNEDSWKRHELQEIIRLVSIMQLNLAHTQHALMERQRGQADVPCPIRNIDDKAKDF